MECQFCNKICKNKKSKAQHEIRCNYNPNKKDMNFGKGDKHPKFGKKGGNQFTKAKENGYECKISEETRRRISESSKNQVWDSERRRNHSIKMKQVVEENPDSYSKNNVCGRVKITEYKDGINLKGSWEVKVAEWLDAQGIIWENEVNPKPYYWDGDWKLYFPDFYLNDYDCYIEVKGYRTDRDIAKWDHFDCDLLVFEKEAIDKIDQFNIEYALNNFIW